MSKVKAVEVSDRDSGANIQIAETALPFFDIAMEWRLLGTSDLHLEAEAVVGEADVFRELGVGVFVAQVVADVGEPGVFRFEFFDERE